jgi:hypothetical protein
LGLGLSLLYCEMIIFKSTLVLIKFKKNIDQIDNFLHG